MSIETQEIIRLCEELPESRRNEVADFARFLLSREDDEKWERILADERPRPKLESFLRESASGSETPLDLDRL